eukprot:c10036_g2_i2.p1 GENE.c10036_g2_i2~~c10036_g2_i2.p1  ORF type:complete len:553 (+),score=129.58 c10036_g2_i2:133-1659(+)
MTSRVEFEDKKLNKWRKLNSGILNSMRYFEAEQGAPLKQGWLKRRAAFGGDWNDYYMFLKGHFIYLFNERKKKSRCKGVVLIIGAHCEVTTDIPASSLYLFKLKLAVHSTPHFWYTNKKYRSVHSKYRLEHAHDGEDDDDNLDDAAAALKKCLFIDTIELAANSDRLRKEWVHLINFLGQMQHAGNSKLEALAKKTKIPAVTAPILELGNELAKKKYEKWKQLFLHQPMLLDIRQPVDKEGYIKKIGGTSALWQKRFFVLKGHYLYYFDKAMPSARAKGIIYLRNAKITPVTYSGIDMVLRIDSIFPRRYPTTDADIPVFFLSFSSQKHMEGWWDVLQTHASLLHAGRSKTKQKAEMLKKVRHNREFGNTRRDETTGAWLAQVPTTASEKIKQVYQPTYRDRHQVVQILDERKRLKKLNAADITVELKHNRKKIEQAALANLKHLSALQQTLDPGSMTAATVDPKEELLIIEEMVYRPVRGYAEWKEIKTRTSARLGEKLRTRVYEED